MSAAEPTPVPPPDPLGRDRCANCLYDLRGLAKGSPCPECGYVLPDGVTVLTLRRAAPGIRDSIRSVGGITAGILAVVTRDPGAFEPVEFLGVLALGVIAEPAIRWAQLLPRRGRCLACW